jgi:hypothetical protein
MDRSSSIATGVEVRIAENDRAEPVSGGEWPIDRNHARSERMATVNFSNGFRFKRAVSPQRPPKCKRFVEAERVSRIASRKYSMENRERKSRTNRNVRGRLEVQDGTEFLSTLCKQKDLPNVRQVFL